MRGMNSKFKQILEMYGVQKSATSVETKKKLVDAKWGCEIIAEDRE